jgi:Holliday junction resolvase
MSTPDFHEIGKETGKIDVRISYRIIQLFSEGLYSSPSKAIEELVSNSFDAGATNVHVLLAPDLTTDEATIVVIDDGDGMDEDGLRQHWLIGVSDKRGESRKPPKGRPQIGRFGIGKLATYVLAKRLTHVTKRNGEFFSTSIDYAMIPGGEHGGIYTEKRVALPLRKLTQEQAKMAVEPWTKGDKPGYSALKLFGAGAAKSWTVAVMSELKDMATSIHRGKLRYVLSTAMPLRDDFRLFLNGDDVPPSKLTAKRWKTWVLGKTLKALPKPAPNEEDLEPTEKDDESKDSIHRYGLTHRHGLGRVTGYVELFEESLTGGKSDEAVGRSHGFFIYVRGRLINPDDEHFGIDRNLLRHGTLNKIRAVVHIDSLDEELRSSRESVREGALFNHAKNLLQGIFNHARSALDKHDEDEDEGAWTAKRVASSPTSLTRLPILGMVESALLGKCSPRYTSYPSGLKGQERDAFVEKLHSQTNDGEGFIRDVRIVDLSQDLGIAVLDIETGILQINSLHPFVAYFLDEYEEKQRSRPLKLLATSEVLMEAHLYSQGLDEATVRDTMARRDQLLRYLAMDSGKRSARLIAQALCDAATDKDALERELVASFTSMGYKAVPLGGSGKPDGMAEACLPAKDGKPQRYAVSLEAKSKEKEGVSVANDDVRVSTIARHRELHGCDHALVVGPDFSTKKGDSAALIQEIKENNAKTGKTITLVRVNDLARLVRLQPLKRLNHSRLREFFQKCMTPDEAKAWIDGIAAEKRGKPIFKDILEIIAEEQEEQPGAAVDYGAVRSGLRRSRDIKMEPQEVIDICRVLHRLAPEYVTALETAVELTQRPDKVLEAIGAAIRDYPEDEQV